METIGNQRMSIGQGGFTAFVCDVEVRMVRVYISTQ